MNWTKKIKLLIFLLFFSVNFYAQRGLVRYTREAGLNSNAIHDVTFDNSGFTWLATSKGIDRFDGQRVIHFSHEEIDTNSISSNDIRTIQCSKNGKIWATTLNQGIIRIDPFTLQISNYSVESVHNFASNHVKELVLVGENMWLVFEDKLQFFVPDFNRLNTYTIPKLDFDENFVQLIVDKNNPKLIWLITNKRFFEFNYAAVTWSNHPMADFNDLSAVESNFSLIRMNKAITDSKGNFYIGLENGNMMYYDKFQHVYRVIENPYEAFQGVPISSLDWRDERYLYLCSYHKEIILFDTRNKAFVRFEKNERGALFPVRIKTQGTQLAIASEIGLYMHDESLIFGTKVNFDYRILSIQHYNKFEYQLIETNSGYFIKKSSGQLIEVRNLKNPFQLMVQENKFILIGENGIVYLNQNGSEFSRTMLDIDSKSNVKIVSFTPVRNNKFYVATSEGSILEVAQHKLKTLFVARTAIKRLLVEESIFPALTYINEKLLFSIGSDLYEYHPRQKRPIKRFHMADYVTSLLYTHDKQLWVGTSAEGIHVMDYSSGRILRKINSYMGMQDDEVFSMVEDTKGRIWVLNKRCVAVLNTMNWSILSLEPRNGMGQVTKIRVLDNFIYFLDQNGFVKVNSDVVFPKLKVPKPYVLRVRDINTKQFIFSKANLNYKQNNLVFEFGVQDYSNGENNLVSYRLLGIDNQWQSGNQKDEASYFNLPNGGYQFQVKVIEDGRIYIETFDFSIQKPFFRTWWFFLIIVVLATLSLWFFMRSRIKRIKNAEEVRSEFNLKINELESKALRAQMNPHFLFNSLNSIRLFILKNEVDSAADYIAKFSKLLRMILNHSRQDMITVYDEIQSLKLYLEFERLRFDQDFDFDLQIDGQEVLDCQIPPMIIQPFVENAIWHGLMPKEGGRGLIRVSFLKQQSGLYVTVQDNGVGRDKAKENNRKRSLKEGSVGLEITKDRLKWLTMRTNYQNEFEIEDLVDENGKPIGTLVTLYFETPNKL